MPPLGYSTNLHAAETVDAVVAFLGGFAREARTRLGWERLGVDLRLGSRAIAELADPARCTALRRALDAAGASAHSLNAFPLRPFQAAVVKMDAYRPDWSEVAREHDTTALIPIALALSDEPLITISTVPGSYKPFGPECNDPARIAAALGRWAAAAARAARECGRSVVLCLEPEPWCFLETSGEVAAFWRGALAEHGVAAAAAALDHDAAAGRAAVATHLGICFDTCHTSLAFEDQAAAVRRMTAAGARIAKCQFSAAPEVIAPHQDSAGTAALRALAEPRFLHQTCARDPAGRLSQVQDLDALDECLARCPQAVAVRSHFHVPVFREAVATGLSSTIADSRAGLAACIAAGCGHLSVETYTWSILGRDEQDVLAGTVRELGTLAGLITPA